MTSWQQILSGVRRTKDRAKYLYLCAEALSVRVRTLAEIGVYRGGLSLDFRARFPEAHMHLIDPWAHIAELRRLRGRMHRAGRTSRRNQRIWEEIFAEVQAAFAEDKRVTIHRKLSREAAPEVPDNSLDLCYIDGDHRYEFVVEDIKLWLPKVRSGGILSGHDYKASRAQWTGERASLYKVYQAVNDTLGQENIIKGKGMTWVWVKP